MLQHGTRHALLDLTSVHTDKYRVYNLYRRQQEGLSCMCECEGPTRVEPTCNRLCLLLPPVVPVSAASSCLFRSDGTWYSALANGLVIEPYRVGSTLQVVQQALGLTVFKMLPKGKTRGWVDV